MPEVELQPITEDDEWLTVALETDPAVMAELGGAWTDAEARATHARRLRSVREHDGWWLKIVRMSDGIAVGSLVLWDSEWAGAPVSEAGWMVLPEYQGNGYASAGVRLMLERAGLTDRWGEIHASPGATNGPSNAICRKLGFEHVGEGDVDYGDRRLHVNHWVFRAPTAR